MVMNMIPMILKKNSLDTKLFIKLLSNMIFNEMVSLKGILLFC